MIRSASMLQISSLEALDSRLIREDSGIVFPGLIRYLAQFRKATTECGQRDWPGTTSVSMGASGRQGLAEAAIAGYRMIRGENLHCNYRTPMISLSIERMGQPSIQQSLNNSGARSGERAGNSPLPRKLIVIARKEARLELAGAVV
jgi:hypothetical protein